MLKKLLLALALLVGAFALAPTSGQAAVPFGTAATVAGENTLKAEPARYRRYRGYRGYRHRYYRPRYYRPRYYQRRYYAPRRFYGHRRYWF